MEIASFYRAFEERYYSPRAVIRRMRAQYLPFVQPLAARYPGAPTFDIGCGRGEWLEHMQELGFNPLGMDLDQGMLADCRAHGLPARQGDAVANLASLPDASQAVISAFHVVEHLSFEQLWAILTQAQRVLLPGGLLIMETPNPDNLRVATHNFYLDPTHRQPIPAMLLSFLAEHHGFARVLVRPLQESPELRAKPDPSLAEVITGASPDYAVIAQKIASAAVLESFASAFASQGGLALQDLAIRYDAAIAQRIQSANEAVTAHFEAITDNQAQVIHNQAQALQHHDQALQEQAQRLQEYQAHYQQLVEQLANERAQLLASASWRITAPLRALHSQLMRLGEHALQLPRATARAALWPARLLLAGAIKTAFAMPGLRAGIATLLQKRFPVSYDWLVHFALRRGLLPGSPPGIPPGIPSGETSAQAVSQLPNLTPCAQRLRADLLRASAAHHSQEAR